MNWKEWLRLLILPTQFINDELPKAGLIYEVGSGIGVIAFELAKKSHRRTVIGLDTDSQKVQKAKSEFKLANLSYKIGDALVFHYSPCVGVVMSDFLHHLPYHIQDLVLKRVTQKLKKSGVLVVKEIARDDYIFMLFSRMWDYLLYPEDQIYYRSRGMWRKILQDLGYRVSVTRKVHWFPGSTHLFVCRKI